MLYFFNQVGSIRDTDDVGTDLADTAEARIEAVKFASEILRDCPEILLGGQDLRIEVANDQGLIQFTVIAMAIDAPSTQGS